MERQLQEGVCAVLLDIDAEALNSTVAELSKKYGKDVVRGVVCDVTSEESVIAAYAQATVEYGGVDILHYASAYLSREPVQLGTLRGQDIGKAMILSVIVMGILLATLGVATQTSWPQYFLDFFRDVK